MNPPSDRMCAHGFRHCFTPLSGCFSPFPHGTGTLSVIRSYLALEGGPPGFRQGFTCPALLRMLPSAVEDPYRPVTCSGGAFHPASVSSSASRGSPTTPGSLPVWASPRSLAATWGISVDVFSSGYLDVSVRRVGLARPMCSASRCPDRSGRVVPFGFPGVTGSLRLAPDFRSLSRPSSPADA